MNGITINDFYAKTVSNGIFGQTVEQHCICVGEMAWRIAEFYEYNKINKNELGLICSLHDIGKMSPIFQYKIGNDSLISAFGYDAKYPSIYDVNQIDRNKVDIDTGKHSGAGVHYFNKFIKVSNKKTIQMLISRHHGFSAFGTDLCTEGNNRMDMHCGDADMKEYVLEIVDALEKHFNFKIDNIGKISGIDLDMVSGYLSIADWISSRELAGTNDISAIDFDAVLVKYGFRKMQMFDKTQMEMFGFNLYDYQNEVVDKINDYGFHILEMGTGYGKTEIALASAYKLIKSGKCSGMYFALPTQVTSNKIFQRVDKFITAVSDEPSTDLVHSNRMQVLFELGQISDSDKDESFFNSNKNLRLLNNVVTGTVDQLLFSVLNLKYNFIRIASLWHKVIIIDEVHCYDSYTTELICRLKEFCLENECVVIALSATVSDTLKGKLFGASIPFMKDYPLLSMTNNGVFQQIPIKASGASKKYNVTIEKNDNSAIYKAIADAKVGKQILWIENTVVKAQDIYEKIANMINGTGIALGLLHSHFTQHDRLQNEGRWLNTLGKEVFFGKEIDEKTHETRASRGRILISTQVAEQSLDIDADKLYTRLCPIDAFGQRLGRVGRFGRNVNEFEVIVLSEHSCEDYRNNVDLEWFFHAGASEYSAFIYPRVVLYNTLEYLENHSVIEYPKDYRDQLNQVYDNMAEIPGFDRYNDFLYEFTEDEERSIEAAQNIEAKHGYTNEHCDVKTRQIMDDGRETLLIKTVNGNKYTLLSGYVLDMGKGFLTLEDYTKIGENIVSVKVDDNVTVNEKHSDFEKVYSVDMTATVDLMNDYVVFFNNLYSSLSGCSYNSKEGLKKI